MYGTGRRRTVTITLYDAARRWSTIVLRFAGACLVCAAIFATIVPRLSLQQLTNESDVILQARIVRSWTEWDSAHQFIWTHYELDPADFLKGQRRSKLNVSEPGGTVESQSMDIQGTPHFRPDEELILFLYRTPIGFLRTVGYGQGRYKIAAGRIQMDLSGIQLANNASPSGSTALETLNGLSVTDFKRRVRVVVAEQQRTPGR